MNGVANERSISITVNGVPYTKTVAANTLLVDFIRDHLELTGTKNGCSQGICGSCTVIADGVAVKSCLMLAAQADGAHITTIEGLSESGQLHKLQAAFIEQGAVQCGFCIPGMIMTAKAHLDEEPNPTPDSIREALSNNLCRCTGYTKIVAAVQAAAAAGE